MKKLRSSYRYMAYGLIAVFFAMGMITLSGGNVFAAPDFFSNTQTIDARAGDAAGVGNTAPTNPGFNPCAGAGAAETLGECTGTPDATSLLTSTNLDATFQQAGPGAITDNMFGVVSGPDATPAASGGPITTDKCGKVTDASLGGLNCGDLRITPDRQGQVIPSFPATNSLTQPQVGNFDLAFDSNPSAAGHVGMNLTNRFAWIPDAISSTTLAADGIDCAALSGGSAATPNICSSQTMRQVVQIGGGASGVGGTEGTPSADDQVVDVTTTFQTLSSINTDDTGLPSTPFNVVMTSTIIDPDMVGGGAGFSQTIGFTFSHNAEVSVGVPQVFDCPSGSGNICTQYPNGPSMTTGSIGGAELPAQ